MIDAVLDTTVILHLFRKYPPAIQWFNNQQRYGVASITWLEVMEGASTRQIKRGAKHFSVRLICFIPPRLISSGQCSS